MNKLAAGLFIALLIAFFIYFAGTPFSARVTGFPAQTVSLVAGFAVVLLGVSAIVLARIWSSRRGRVQQ